MQQLKKLGCFDKFWRMYTSNKFAITCILHILYNLANREPAYDLCICLVHLLADENAYIAHFRDFKSKRLNF